MAKLVGRSLVKNLANVATADTRWDAVFDAMIEEAGAQVEDVTGRIFEYGARVEYHRSHEQVWGDRTPQWVIVQAPPIDVGETVTLVWAPFDDHDDNGTTLELDVDYRYETNAAGDVIGFRIQRFSSWPETLPVPAGTFSLVQQSPTGWRASYTGGYAASAAASAIAGQPGRFDPYDVGEAEVVAVPSGLQFVIAAKIAEDFLFLRSTRMATTVQEAQLLAQLVAGGGQRGLTAEAVGGGFLLRPWTPQQRAALDPWKLASQSWIR
jgi:hypothetical protein